MRWNFHKRSFTKSKWKVWSLQCLATLSSRFPAEQLKVQTPHEKNNNKFNLHPQNIPKMTVGTSPACNATSSVKILCATRYFSHNCSLCPSQRNPFCTRTQILSFALSLAFNDTGSLSQRLIINSINASRHYKIFSFSLLAFFLFSGCFLASWLNLRKIYKISQNVK